MTKRIIIVGNSQLAFFVACMLDRSLGDNTHTKLTWLTATKSLLTTGGERDISGYKFYSLKPVRAAIRSINLRDRRIVSTKGSYDYDLIIIDQTPVYSSIERDQIADQFETLLASLRSKENRGVAAKAKVAFLGSSAECIQMALNFSERRSRDSSQSVSTMRIELPSTGSEKLNSFLKEQQISLRRSQAPGIEIKPPIPMISSKKIRGLKLDLSGRPLLLATLEPLDHPSCSIIDSDDRNYQNISRSDWVLAKQLSENIIAKLDGGPEKIIDSSSRKQIHSTRTERIVCLGEMSSQRNRAKLVYALDNQLWKKLLGKR